MVVKQTEYLKSQIYEVVKSSGFILEEVAAKVLNIKGELDNQQDNNISNNQVVDKEYKET